MGLKFRGNLYALVAVSAAYCGAIPFLPDNAVFLWVAGVLVVVNFVLSMRHLIRRGHLSWDLIALNLVQLVLFGCLHVQIHDVFGAHHYTYAASPQWYHWVQLIAAHVLRAIDILDGIEAYGISLQRIKNATAFSGTMLVGMHIMVDVFLFSALVQFVHNRAAPAMRECAGMLHGFRQKLLESAEGISFSKFWIIPALCLVVQLAACFGMVILARLGTAILWLSDNVLRTFDVGDAFQIYGWRLHNVEMGPALATLAVAVRLAVAWCMAPLLARYSLFGTGGRGWTVDALVQILQSEESRPSERAMAFKALVAKDQNSNPVTLAIAKMAAKEHACGSIAEMLYWIDSAAASAIRPPVTSLAENSEGEGMRHGAPTALHKTDLPWQSSEEAKGPVTSLVRSLAHRDASTRLAAAKKLEEYGSMAAPAVPALVMWLTDEDGRARLVAAEVLQRIGPKAVPAVPALVELLTDEDGRVRAAAARAVGGIGPAAVSALTALVKVLGDDVRDVRVAAAWALEQIGAMERLVQLALFEIDLEHLRQQH